MISANTGDKLNELLVESAMEPLDSTATTRFSTYLELLLRWNRRLNLTAIRAAEEILSRHFVESIFCARNLPSGITSLLDYGSGAGLPGVPIACCRDEILVTLGESHSKKASFLREVVRSLQLSSRVFGSRCEDLPPRSFSAVTLRAVDRMGEAVRSADKLIAPEGWMVLLISAADGDSYRSQLRHFIWRDPLSIPNLPNGIVMIGQRVD